MSSKGILNIEKDWSEIRRHFNRSFSTNFHVSIASITEDNNPTVTPIGSLFLNSDQTGFYFEKYPSRLPRNAEINNKVCVLAVNSGTWFWIRSLLKGKFGAFPGVRLFGELGERREATDKEINRLNRRMKATRGFKGNTYLWGDMKEIRLIYFKKAELINLGVMTSGLQGR